MRGIATVGALVLASLLVAEVPRASAEVMYVDLLGTWPNDGSSWKDAFVDLQDALDRATHLSGTTQIWVARGTYTPSDLRDAGVARSATFQLLNNTELYGGFLGNAHPYGGETSLEERDYENNVTILSGWQSD